MPTGENYSGLRTQPSATVLLILDMISRFEFPDGTATARAARRIAPQIAKLKKRLRAEDLAVLYVNDNPGVWRSDSMALIRDAASADSRGRRVLDHLRPTAEDYFILKPRHSAFFATPLELLLENMKARRLILTGVSSHQCVLFTANDAHVRNFELIVPSDCIGAPTASQTRLAISYFTRSLHARVMPQGRLRLR